MIHFTKAQDLIFKNVERLKAEIISIDQAYGKVLTEELKFKRNVPPFDRALVNGFAVRSRDISEVPVVLKKVGTCLPGEEPKTKVLSGKAVEIFSGAPLPPGADAVVKAEDCKITKDSVAIREAIRAGQNVSAAGKVAKAGEPILEAGSMINTSAVAAMSAAGITMLKVIRPPRIGIAITGNEYATAGATPSEYQINNVNGPALKARCSAAGGQILDLGVIRHEEEEFDALLKKIAEVDCLVLTGGVSIGQHDFVRQALNRREARVLFDGVAVKPGMPTTLVRLEKKPVFVLPALPVSCLISAELFLIPAIRALMGKHYPRSVKLRAELKGRLSSDPEVDTLVPATMKAEHGVLSVTPLRLRGSSDIVGYSKAQALIVVSPDVEEYDEYSIVDVLPLPGTGWFSD